MSIPDFDWKNKLTDLTQKLELGSLTWDSNTKQNMSVPYANSDQAQRVAESITSALHLDKSVISTGGTGEKRVIIWKIDRFVSALNSCELNNLSNIEQMKTSVKKNKEELENNLNTLTGLTQLDWEKRPTQYVSLPYDEAKVEEKAEFLRDTLHLDKQIVDTVKSSQPGKLRVCVFDIPKFFAAVNELKEVKEVKKTTELTTVKPKSIPLTKNELAEVTSLIRQNNIVSDKQSFEIKKEVINSRLSFEIVLLDHIQLESSGNCVLTATVRRGGEMFTAQIKYNLTPEKVRTLIEVLKRKE